MIDFACFVLLVWYSNRQCLLNILSNYLALQYPLSVLIAAFIVSILIAVFIVSILIALFIVSTSALIAVSSPMTNKYFFQF